MLPADWRTRSDGPGHPGRRLAPLTSWRIGGAAELYVEPRTREELADVVADLWRSGQPWRLLGGGSNLLVSDRGVRDVVLSLRKLRSIEIVGNRVVVDAGAPLHSVVRRATRAGLSGVEPLAGIPGQLGGAVFGNAGGGQGDIGSLIDGLDLMAPDGTASRVVPGPGFFRYRKSLIGDRIVVGAVLRLWQADSREVSRNTRRIIRARRDTQPGWVGNAGCVFRNPDGDNAGRLIDAAGCKNQREGGIIVSPIHANFFENPEGRGSADDVLRLVDRVRARVAAVHGVELRWEVRRWMP